MPQFDISAFGVQLLTMLLGFLGFYFLFSWKYLPSWAFLLKTRKKHFIPTSLENSGFENSTVSKKTSHIKFTSKYKSFFFTRGER